MAKIQSKSNKIVWLSIVLPVLLIGGLGISVGKLLLTDNGIRRKKAVHMVTLVKPMPPPLPPLQKIDKPIENIEQEVVEQEIVQLDSGEISENPDDEPPPGEELGLDADGTAGSDGFGLKAKKGARALVGGGRSGGSGGGSLSLLRKYGWYAQIIQTEIRDHVRRHLDKNGGIPKGKFVTIVRIVLDKGGDIVDYKLVDSSGNREVDNAVLTALDLTNISEPPPEDMPKAIKLEITSQG